MGGPFRAREETHLQWETSRRALQKPVGCIFGDSAASVFPLVDLIDTVFAVGAQGAHLPISRAGFIICRW